MSVSAFNNGLLLQFILIQVPDIDRAWSRDNIVLLPTAFSSNYMIIFGDTTPWGPQGNGVATHNLESTQFMYSAFNTGGNWTGVIAIGI